MIILIKRMLDYCHFVLAWAICGLMALRTNFGSLASTHK